jgi:TolB protein
MVLVPPGAGSSGASSTPVHGKIAYFARAGTSGEDIFAVDQDGSGLVRLTHDKHGNRDPAWSPDGSRMAFSGFLHFRNYLYVMDSRAGTRSAVRITEGPAHHAMDDATPDWSPDGTKIAFTRIDHLDYAIETVDPDGSDLVRIASGVEPNWSPDGTTIVFSCKRNGQWDLCLVRPDGSGLRRLLSLPASNEYQPAWSPDGQQVAFVSDANHVGTLLLGLYVVSTDGTGLVQLTNGETFDKWPTWSPDSSHIAFVRDTTPTSGDTSDDLYVIKSDGTSVRQITFVSGFDMNPDWGLPG